MYWHSLVLLLLFSLFQPFFSSTITVYRNMASSGGDQVENKDCKVQECKNINTTCASAADGGCCRCECPSLKPNFVVGKGVCLSNDEVKTQLKSDCKYDLRPAFADLRLTTQSSGEKNFSKKHDVICDFSIEASIWESLNSKAKWENGVGNIFSVNFEPIQLGPKVNDYKLIAIKWSGTLHNHYTGTIIRINITCGKELGCVLAKVTGQKTYDTINPQPPPAPTQPPPTTTGSPTTTSSPTTTQTTTTAKKPESSSNVLVPVLAAVGAFIVIVIVIAAIIIICRRKQKRNRDAGKDPIYAEVNKGYLRSQLGPLPSVPGEESPYQSLERTTMKNKDYDNPPNGFSSEADYDNLPALSYPEKNAPQKTTSDHSNSLPVEGGDSEQYDYDVPPTNAKDSATINDDEADTSL